MLHDACNCDLRAWHLYIVRCRDNSLYTGIATDVRRRFAQHQNGNGKGAKYLRGKAPLRVVFRIKVGDYGAALRLELQIKRLTKARKESLVARPRKSLAGLRRFLEQGTRRL